MKNFGTKLGRRKFAVDVIDAMQFSPLASVVTDPALPDNPVIGINPAFTTLTGYTDDFSIGRNCRFLGGLDTSSTEKARLREAVAMERAIVVELLNYRADGTEFLNAVMIAPVRDALSDGILMVGSQVDVTGNARGQRTERQDGAVLKLARLTPRQYQVLQGMVQGLRNRQIAARLGIGEKTVKMHRAALLERLEVATSADALRVGLEAGLSHQSRDG